MEFKGNIIHILEPRSFTSKNDGKNFVIQDFVIENNETQFPRKMTFSVFGEDRIKEMNIQMGELLTVKFDIDAREFNGRWFNDVRAWRVERTAPQQYIQQPQQYIQQPQQLAQQIPAPTAPTAYAQTAEDLPF